MTILLVQQGSTTMSYRMKLQDSGTGPKGKEADDRKTV